MSYRWIWLQPWRRRGEHRLDTTNFVGSRMLLMVVMLLLTHLAARLAYATIGRAWLAHLMVWAVMLLTAHAGQYISTSQKPLVAGLSVPILSIAFGWMDGMVCRYLRLPHAGFVPLLAVLAPLAYGAMYAADERCRRPEFWQGLMKHYWRYWPVWWLMLPALLLLASGFDWRFALQVTLAVLLFAWTLRTMGRGAGLDRTVVNVFASTAAVYADVVYICRGLADMVLRPEH